MEKSKSSALIKRVVTALIMAPLALAVIVLGYPVLYMAVLTVGALLAWEWSNMVPNKKPAVYGIAYVIPLAVSIMIFSSWAAWAAILATTAFVWLKARGEEHRKLLALGVPYISIGVGSLIWLYNIVGAPTTIWFVIVIWCVDIGGYVVGCNLKGPKLAPKVSPNKTWSGLFGGILFAVLASIAYSALLGSKEAYLAFALLGALIAVVEQAGDLIESMIKRSLGLKDSSDLIPGHGGIFDRVDGMIFAAPFVVLLFRYGFLLF